MNLGDLSPVKQKAILLRVLPKEDGGFRTITEIMKEVKRRRQAWYEWLDQDADFREQLSKAYDLLIDIQNKQLLNERLNTKGFPLDKVVEIYLKGKPVKTESDVNVKGKITLEQAVKELADATDGEKKQPVRDGAAGTS